MGGIGYISSVFSRILYDNTAINVNMIESIRKIGIDKCFFSSSACVYPLYRQNKPDISGLKEHEAFPCEPDSYYGLEKIYFEKVLEAYHKDYDIQVRIARFHNIFGPNGTWQGGKEKAPAALCRKVIMATDPGKIVIWGDGKQTRSFMFIDDCLEGFYRLMCSDYNLPMNIGSDRMITIDELADIITQISGKRIEKTYDLNAPQGVRGRNSDNSLMRKILNWEPKISLEQGLEKTYEWITKQINEM
jgi:nucleoside-diphosphate-sugar epimerase